VVLIITLIPFNISGSAENTKKGLSEMDFLKANGRDLKNNYGKGDIVNLRGTNVGGYLLQEFWMTPTSASSKVKAEIDIYKILKQRFGEDVMYDLVALYQKNYFTEKDFDNCAEMGMNCLRLPLWYRNLVDENGEFYKNAFDIIDLFAEQAGKRDIYVILDMHGAPGSQSGSDHSGVDGGNKKEAASEFFFGVNAAANQELFYKIWEAIAERYKNNPVIAGYDLLNEPYCTYRYSSSRSESQLRNSLWKIYDNAYKRIREIDSDHVIIMEAVWDPSDLPEPSQYNWTNIMYQYHNYGSYSADPNDSKAIVDNMRAKLNLIINKGYNVPSYMGEFTYYDKIKTWEDGLALFNESGINWTTWTYKTTSGNNNWGLYHHKTNTKVNIETATLEKIKEVWQNVGNSTPNTQLIKVVSKYFKEETKSNNLAPKQADLKAGNYYFKGFNTNKIVSMNDKFQLFSKDSKFTSADNQIFTLIINDDGTFSMLSKETGKYVSVNKSSKKLYANADTIGNNEKFYIYQQGSAISIKSVATGLYVCSDENLSGIPLIADRSGASSWEQFYATLIDEKEEKEPVKKISETTEMPEVSEETQNINVLVNNETEENSAPPEKMTNMTVIVIVGGIIVVGLIGLVFVLVKRK
jgi:aryl-phospho-beta-D-glucosidase BglC (GH1 family)